jgi:dTDP-D-glucose 4,6-dehydratase
LCRHRELTHRNDWKGYVHGKGTGLRNFLHTSDVVNAFDIILRKGQLHQVYNIGTTFEISIVDMCKQLIKIIKGPNFDPEDWIEHVPDRAFNDSRYMIDSSKLKELGWREAGDFETKLKETVDWYLSNLDWWPPEVVHSYLSPHPLAYGPKNPNIDKSNSQLALAFPLPE